MATQTTGGGSVTSFYNAPQASDDLFDWGEDQLLADANLYNQGTRTLFLDVMSDDLGGKAKSLFSIVDDTGALTDLLTSNVTTGWEQTADGNWIRIYAGKIEFRIGTDGSTSPTDVIDVNTLGADDVVNDTFLYSIRLGNGTISYATVTVTIQGVNDGAVITEQGGADHAVVEAGGVNNDTPGDPSALGNLDVTDVDAGENHFEAADAADLIGDYGNFTFDESSGAWTYTLDNTLDATQALNEGDAVTDTLRVYSHDGTYHDIVVNITGTNDAPVAVADDNSGDAVKESGVQDGGNVAEPGDASATGNVLANDTDVDSAATLSVAAVGGVSGDVGDSVTGTYGSVTINADGSWTYTLNNSDPQTQALAQGASVTDTFEYTVSDQYGATSVASLVITITGTNDAPTAAGDVASVDEDSSTSGTVATNDGDDDTGALLTYALNDPGNAPVGLVFNADGSWTFDAASYDSLPAGEELPLVIGYTVTDQHGASATANLTITVTGVNDAAEITENAGADHAVTEAGGVNNGTPGDSSAQGNLDVTDVDTGEDHFEAADAADLVGDYGNFTFNAMTGAWTYALDNTLEATQALNQGDPATDTLRVYSHDGTFHDIVVNITGTNDAAVITEAAGADHEVVEAGGVNNGMPGDNSAQGDLDVTDVDDGEDHFQAAAPADLIGDYGNFTFDETTGEWTYELDNNLAATQGLNQAAEVTDTLTVLSADGTSHNIVVDITGANDAPVAVADNNAGDPVKESGVQNGGNVAELGDSSATGNVLTNDIDVDTSATKTVSQVNGSGASVGNAVTGVYGSVTIGSNGLWTYTLDNTDPQTQALAQGASVTDTFSYTVTDQFGATSTANLVVTIAGTNDAPTAAGDVASVLEDGNTSGTVATNDNDVDTGASLTFALVNPAPTGLVFNANGSWTFDASSYDSLAGGVPQELVIPYTVTDQHGASATANLTITVTGVNDAAIIAGDVSGDITEDVIPNTVSGTLTAADVDNTPNSFQANAGNTTYGSFTVNSSGQWQYTLNNANAAVQALVLGGVLADSFNVLSEDGTLQAVSITIHGADEPVVGFTKPTAYEGLDSVYDNDGLTGGTPESGTVTGTPNPDTLTGDDSGQTLNGGNGNDIIYGGAGNDTINGNNHDDTLYGQADNDTVNGANGVDTIYGGSGNDIINGGTDGDTIYGGSGNDVVDGFGGNDIIIGGYGQDTLTGGDGNDVFRYLSSLDTNDIIIDFTFDTVAPGIETDQLDLSGIDADIDLDGNQDFEWGGDDGPIANGLWFEVSGGHTTLYGDTNGDLSNAEFMITLNNFTGFSDLAPSPDMITGLVP